MNIILDGVEPGAAANLGEEAFTEGRLAEPLYWHFGTEFDALYISHLVRATSLANDRLQFLGITLATPNVEIGLTGTSDPWEVDLTNREYVYRKIPSTLLNLEPGGTKTYAVLFLSKKYLADNDPSKRLQNAAGGPKWPQSAEAHATLQTLRAELQTLKAENDKLWRAMQEISQHPDSVQSSKLRQFLNSNAP